jgi:imidazolonepropionase
LHGPQGPRRDGQLNDIGIINDGALLVRDGVVQQVGTTRRVENLAEARDAVEINAAGRVVMPGFVDGHTHLLCPAPSAGEDTIHKASLLLRTSSAKRLISVARKHLNSMARHGTTTAEVSTSGGPDLRDEIKLLRVLDGVRSDALEVVPTLVLGVPGGCAPEESAVREHVERVCGELLPKVVRRRLVRFVGIEVSAGLSEEVARRFLQAAAQAGLPAKFHCSGDGSMLPGVFAGEKVVVSLEHLERMTPEQTVALAALEGVATLIPGCGFQRTGAAATVRALMSSGVPIALASDFNPQHTPTLNMQTVVALASMQWDLTAAEAISAATINAAYAAGCGDRAGSLEVGKSADLIVLNISDYRELAGQFGTNLVHLTMKRGAFIYREGDVAPFNAAELRAAW